MELQECTAFASEHPVCFIATEEGDQPRVRGLLLWFADETGFYFMTLSPKSFSAQLHQNPKVEVCFYNNPPELSEARMMRLAGQVEFLDDPELVNKAAADRPFIEQITGRPAGPLTEVFRIASGEAHFWTLADILKEPELERVRF